MSKKHKVEVEAAKPVPPVAQQPRGVMIEQIPTEKLQAAGFVLRDRIDSAEAELNAIRRELNRREIERMRKDRPAVAVDAPKTEVPAKPAGASPAIPENKPTGAK